MSCFFGFSQRTSLNDHTATRPGRRIVPASQSIDSQALFQASLALCIINDDLYPWCHNEFDIPLSCGLPAPHRTSLDRCKTNLSTNAQFPVVRQQKHPHPSQRPSWSANQWDPRTAKRRRPPERAKPSKARQLLLQPRSTPNLDMQQPNPLRRRMRDPNPIPRPSRQQNLRLLQRSRRRPRPSKMQTILQLQTRDRRSRPLGHHRRPQLLPSPSRSHRPRQPRLQHQHRPGPLPETHVASFRRGERRGRLCLHPGGQRPQ